MKNLSLILLLLLSVSVNAQKILQRSSGTSTVEDVRIEAKLNLLIPRYRDTTEANQSQNVGLDSIGATIFTRIDQNIWIRKGFPKRWEILGFRIIPTYSSNAEAIAANLNNGDSYYLPYNNGNYLLAVVVLALNRLLSSSGTPLLTETGTPILTY